MTPRPQSRKRTVLAVAVTAGVTLQSTTMVAQADDKRTVESFLADLVGQVSRAKSQVSEMETLMGSLREDANKARVDLVNSQSAAQTAQDKVVDARGRLKDSDTEVTKAQAKLNDIARSAYAQGGDASAVNLAAGGSDAVGDTLDRSSYIDAASKKQKDEVDRLDLARTQNANEESSLRDSRDKANSAVDDAVSKYNTARNTLDNSQKTLAEKQKEYKRLLGEKSKAEKALREARAAVETFTNTHPEASSWDKRKVAEKAAENAGAKVEKTEKAEDAEDKAQETPAEETQSTGDSTENTENTENAENTEKAQPAEANESTESDQSDQSDQSDESPAQGSLGNPAGLPELPAELQSSYDLNASGDDQRQAALDGLRKAGESALMAGFTTALSGNPDGAVAAAARAGRETAGQEYDRAMGGGTSTAPAAQETPETPTAPETEEATETPEAPETPDEAVTPETPETPENPAEAIADALDPSSPDTSGTAEEKIERVIKRAESQLGLPYAWGGGNFHGPTKGIRDGGVADAHGDYNKVGFDCSGLMMYAFYGVGIELQHYSGYQYTAGKQVPSSEAKRGDMLFWPGHVALYLGDGKMIEAPQSGDVVKISDVRWGGMQPMAVRMIE